MDRRSWLWRRKSSEKSPSGETESSGSVSSHSERLSDDQTLPNLNIQSPEVTCEAAPSDEQMFDESLKTLKEKLSRALRNIHAKEELVNQHAKVAEEAVSGWEKAEKEVFGLKKQNDALNQKTLILEERVSHLDEALKECFRQLRQAKEEQEVAKKENSILKLKLVSKDDELQLRTNERDLSVHAAETASKQHLEAECCRLKAVARKVAVANDYRPTTAPSLYVESFTDSRCLPETSVGKLLIVPSSELDLMDDFLEMERLAALPETGTSDNAGERAVHGELHQRDELESMIKRTDELQDSFKKIALENENLEIVLNKCQIQLQVSEDQREQMEVELVDLRALLALANETKSAVEVELKAAELKLDTMNKEIEEERNFSREAAAKCDKLEADISRMKLDGERQRSAMIEEFRIIQDKDLAVAAGKFAECQGTIASIARQLKSLQAFEDFLIDSDSGG